MGRNVRLVAFGMVGALLGAGGIISSPVAAAPVGAPVAAAVAAAERADTLAQARDDVALAPKQVVRERLHSAKDRDWFRYRAAVKARVVVTLGGLPADYNLGVYRADGSRIARSDHGGKGFERVYFTANKGGVYYLRVASTKGSSSTKYRLSLRTLTDPLSLVSYSVPAVNGGYPFIVAEFANTTPQWRRIGFVGVNSVAADGTTVQRDGLAQTQTVVRPYGLVRVASSTVLPLPAGHHHFSLGADTTVTESRPLGTLIRRSGPVETRNGVRFHTGTVTNTGTVVRGGDTDSTMPTVTVNYYNANGTLVGRSGANLAQMAPGATVGYEIRMINSPYFPSVLATPNRYVTDLVAAN